ncbi:MAG: amidohydrolase [Synergistaceae bacterium]|jgi:predicted amidohydrolase YtcJ|nr:amidohydrolase [Synergistaceae bacterium]
MDTIIKSGKIYVERGKFAEAIRISDGVITSIGTDDEMLSSAQAGTQVIDAGGRTVLPGLNDSHMHLAYLGEALSTLDLSGARSIDEIVARGKEYAGSHPETVERGILGIGWNQDFFDGEKRALNRHDLDRISRDIPIVLKRVCGHSAAANTKAMEICGVTASSPQVEGGVFETEDGSPSGVFKENAMQLIEGAIKPNSRAEWKNFLKKGMAYCLSVGLTSVQSNDARDDDAAEVFGLLRELLSGGELPLRFRHQVTFLDEALLLEYIRTERHDPVYRGDTLTAGPLKLFKDGSLGARTALRREDYRDDPGNRGVDCLPMEQLDRFCRVACENGLQVMTHAIGDGAISQTLDAYGKIIRGGQNVLRHAVNHCQITDMPLLKRIADMGVLVMAQPIFINTDLHVITSRVGPEIASASYAFGRLHRLGVHVSYGSDSPVEDCNPFKCIYSSVTRMDLAGAPHGGYNPDDAVDVETAIDAYTYESAYAEFKENVKGRLKPGFLADLIIIDRDIFTIPPEGIKDISVDLTMVGGKVASRRD